MEGTCATISGGKENHISENTPDATISGGANNTIEGGGSTICGGANNRVIGSYSTVAGGMYNSTAGQYSFAAGYYARATNNRSFVWNGVDTSLENVSEGDYYTFNVYSREIYLNAQDRVNIRDVLRLTPRALAPPNPQEGDIYINGSNDHIYCRIGGTWKQLDN